MRLHLAIVVTLSLGCGATSAQADPVSPPATPVTLTKADLSPLLPSAPTIVVSPHRETGIPQSREKDHDRDVADCMQMWDSGTHMTKQQWASTCKRVQTRLDDLNIDMTMPKTKAR